MYIYIIWLFLKSQLTSPRFFEPPRKNLPFGLEVDIISKRQTMAIKLKPIRWNEEKNRRLKEE